MQRADFIARPSVAGRHRQLPPELDESHPDFVGPRDDAFHRFMRQFQFPGEWEEFKRFLDQQERERDLRMPWIGIDDRPQSASISRSLRKSA